MKNYELNLLAFYAAVVFRIEGYISQVKGLFSHLS